MADAVILTEASTLSQKLLQVKLVDPEQKRISLASTICMRNVNQYADFCQSFPCNVDCW